MGDNGKEYSSRKDHNFIKVSPLLHERKMDITWNPEKRSTTTQDFTSSNPPDDRIPGTEVKSRKRCIGMVGKPKSKDYSAEKLAELPRCVFELLSDIPYEKGEIPCQFQIHKPIDECEIHKSFAVPETIHSRNSGPSCNIQTQMSAISLLDERILPQMSAISLLDERILPKMSAISLLDERIQTQELATNMPSYNMGIHLVNKKQFQVEPVIPCHDEPGDLRAVDEHSSYEPTPVATNLQEPTLVASTIHGTTFTQQPGNGAQQPSDDTQHPGTGAQHPSNGSTRHCSGSLRTHPRFSTPVWGCASYTRSQLNPLEGIKDLDSLKLTSEFFVQEKGVQRNADINSTTDLCSSITDLCNSTSYKSTNVTRSNFGSSLNETPRSHSRTTRSHNETPRSHNESQRSYSRTPRSHNETPRWHSRTPRSHNETPRSHNETPRSQSPQSNDRSLTPSRRSVSRKHSDNLLREHLGLSNDLITGPIAGPRYEVGQTFNNVGHNVQKCVRNPRQCFKKHVHGARQIIVSVGRSVSHTVSATRVSLGPRSSSSSSIDAASGISAPVSARVSRFFGSTSSGKFSGRGSGRSFKNWRKDSRQKIAPVDMFQ